MSRSKQTGNSKHYAFLEFGSAEVARIAAEAMDGYMLATQKLQARVMAVAEVHADLFKGANRVFKKVRAPPARPPARLPAPPWQRLCSVCALQCSHACRNAKCMCMCLCVRAAAPAPLLGLCDALTGAAPPSCLCALPAPPRPQMPWAKIERERHNRDRTPAESDRRTRSAVARDAQRQQRIAAAGIDYAYEPLAALAAALPAKAKKTTFDD